MAMKQQGLQNFITAGFWPCFCFVRIWQDGASGEDATSDRIREAEDGRSDGVAAGSDEEERGILHATILRC